MTCRIALVLAALAGLAACTPSSPGCELPNTACSNNVCADLQTDPQHCGSCAVSCATGQTCVAGVCTCPAGTKLVNGICELDMTPAVVKENTIFATCFNTGDLVALSDDLQLKGMLQVSPQPQALGYSAGDLFLADSSDNALYRFDPTSAPPAKKVGSDRLGKVANQLAIRDGKAFVVNSGDNTVQVIDLSKPAPTSSAASTGRTIDEIPTSIATPPTPANTNPTFAAFAGSKLYVTLLGTCDAPGDVAGNRLLEMDVSTVPGKVTRELVFKAADYAKNAAVTEANSPRPAGLAAIGTKLYVAIGNLKTGCVGSAGPGYLAVVDTAADPLTSKAIQLPNECRNPGYVVASANRVYVSCLGSYGWGVGVEEALVVVDPATESVSKLTTFDRCANGLETGPAACKTAVPGRIAIRGSNLLIGDANAGRILVTDLEGNKQKVVDVCPLSCPGGDATKVCYQYTGDILALP